VHMLSKDAWGALLKTLEEPPKHVIFILATTEFNKVPETIISRCQVFTFKKASEPVLKNMISHVAEQEKYQLEKDAAELLSILADGSFRDGLGELQKVLNFSKGKKIMREDVEKITSAPRAALVNDILSALVEQDMAAALETVKHAANDNLDVKLFFKLIISKFRVAVILRYAPKLAEEMSGDLGEADSKFLKELVKDDKKGILRSEALSVLLDEYQNIDRAFVAELPLELALIKILSKEY